MIGLVIKSESLTGRRTTRVKEGGRGWEVLYAS